MSKEAIFQKYPFIKQEEISECRLMRYDKGYKDLILVENFCQKRGFFDTEGKVIVPLEYSQITLGENFIIADNSYSSVVYDYEGNNIMPVSETYRYVSYIGKLILQGAGNGTKVYDKTGKEVEEGVVYDEVFMQHDEFLAVKLNGHWKVLYSV